jgi:hypothetical protein
MLTVSVGMCLRRPATGCLPRICCRSDGVVTFFLYGNVFTEPLPSNRSLLGLHNFRLQASCHNSYLLYMHINNYTDERKIEVWIYYVDICQYIQEKKHNTHTYTRTYSFTEGSNLIYRKMQAWDCSALCIHVEMVEKYCQNTECFIFYPKDLYYVCIGICPVQLLKLKSKFVNFLETVHLTISE